jgi:hypothetical protein
VLRPAPAPPAVLHACTHAQVFGTQSVCDFLAANQPWKQYLQGGNLTLMPPVVPGTPLQLSANLTVTAAAVPHRAEFSDAVGFYIQVCVCFKTPSVWSSKLQQASVHRLFPRGFLLTDQHKAGRATTCCLLTLAHSPLVYTFPHLPCRAPAKRRSTCQI